MSTQVVAGKIGCENQMLTRVGASRFRQATAACGSWRMLGGMPTVPPGMADGEVPEGGNRQT
jgi:hypothetical protein